jgi:hypothetical protein
VFERKQNGCSFCEKEKYVHSLRMMTKMGHPALAVRVQHSAALE